MSDGVQESSAAPAEQLEQLTIQDQSNGEAELATAVQETGAGASGSSQQETVLDGDKDQKAALASQLDPAIRQALLDGNRETVLKLEETVQQFLADSSQSSLQFPPSISNYQRLLEHKVSQHHQLQTITAFENGQPRVVAKRPTNITPALQQKLADIDIATIKIEPKALVKRPSSQQQHHGHSSSQQQQQQNRQRSHKEREAEYHEARARIIGSSSASNLAGNGSSSNLAGMGGNPAGSSGNLAGNRPASAGASTGGATLGNSYLAAGPPTAGERGFNIVNPGRGAGRGSSSVAAAAAAPGVAAPGRGSQNRGARTVQPEPSGPAAAAASSAAVAGGARSQRTSPAQQQQQYGAGPKAIYRDKQRDVQDPDYARGVDRYQQRFDPGYGVNMQQQQQQGGMYVMPTYGSEFPSLGSAYGGQQQQQQTRPRQQGRGQRHQSPQQQQAAAADGYNGQQQQDGNKQGARPPAAPGRSGSSAQQQQQQQMYNQAYDMQAYSAAGGYPMGADPAAAAAAMYGQMYGGYAAGGYMNPAAAAAAAAYGGYGGGYMGGYGDYNNGYNNYGGYNGQGGYGQMGYGGYNNNSYNGGGPQWQQGYGQQQQQQQGGRPGKGTHRKQDSADAGSSSNGQQQ